LGHADPARGAQRLRRVRRLSSPRPDRPHPEAPLQAKAAIDRAKDALPDGTFVVGLGLIVASAAAYGVVIIVNAAIGDREYSGFGAFWALLFIFGPGIFLPLEQEVGRAISHRIVAGEGSGPVVKRAALVGLIVAVVFALIFTGAAQPLVDHVFHGSYGLLIGFILGMFGFYAMHLARGTLSGNGRFVPYGVILGAEGLIRLILVVMLAVVGVDKAGPYGIAMGVAPFIAVLAILMDRHGLLEPGPHSEWSELSTALVLLLLGSACAQLLAYGALLYVNVKAGNSHGSVSRSFTNAFFIARIPVLMFMAVQAALLPKLARFAAADAHLDFRAALKRLVQVVVAVAILGTVLAWVIGPFVGKILFGEAKFGISSTDLGVLAAGSGAYVIVLTLAQALIALKGYWRALIAWFSGCAIFGVALVVLDVATALRASAGFLLGSAGAIVVMGVLLLQKMRGAVLASAMPLVEALAEHEAAEI
jgi:O-antigen/teichoic acid export membrane protein